MADTTESKTYIIKIQSDLEKYTKEAIAAKKATEDTQLAVDNLKKGLFKSREEIEKTNAAHRNAKKEYTDLTKLIDLANKALKAEGGSYEQLLRVHRLNEIALKTASGTMKRNEDGTYSLTAKYIALSKNVDTSKRALDAFGKGIHDNRLNVGNYSEALKGALGSISAMPGPLGRAAAGAENFAATFAKIGPIGALIGGALLAISAPLVAFFKSSEEGIELLERKVAGFKASINVLKGDLISLGKSMVGEQGDEAAPWGSRLVKGLRMIATTANLIPGVSKYFDDLAKRMNEAGAAAEKYTLIQQQLEDAERALIVPRAEANLKIKEARLLYADETKSLEVRIGALQTALDLENKTADEEVKHQQFKILNLRDQNEEKRKAGQLRDEDDKILQEAIAREIELRTESVGRQLRAAKTVAIAKAQLLKEESDGIK